MVEALLREQEVEYTIENNNIIANFGENGKITVELSENGFIKKCFRKNVIIDSRIKKLYKSDKYGCLSHFLANIIL